MSKASFIFLLLALAAYGQQTSVAVLPSDGIVKGKIDNDDLEVLTDKMREVALDVLPTEDFVLLKQDVVIKRLGGAENYIKECMESSCIVNLGKKAQVDYVTRADVGKFGNKIRLKVELYNVSTEGLVGILNGEAENITGLLDIVKKRAPAEIFGKIPGASVGKSSAPSVAGGISGVQKTSAYEADDEKLYVVNLSTEPPGAFMSFDGVPATSCPKTPCKAELAGGNVRIIAALEQYEKADTTVLIKQNKQNINIKLKPSFGVLEIKPAYLDGIGSDKPWDLSVNNKLYSLLYSLAEINLSPNKYSVKLSHECYENISFEAGINKGKHEIFDMASNITLKKGGLTLSAERDGEPANEPVFVNDKQVGETPFSGSVPLCAKIEIGKNRETVDVKLRYNEKIKHTHKVQVNKFLTDARDGKKYKIVTIGKQTWMAENMNYDANGSICFNCGNYGRSYDWSMAKTVCPVGWHLPSKEEWEILMESVGGGKTAGKFLKAASGWDGTDAYGFSALPCCRVSRVGSATSYGIIGDVGFWWSSTEYDASRAYSLLMFRKEEFADHGFYIKNDFLTVRCLQDSKMQTETKPSENKEAVVESRSENSFTDSRDGKKYRTVVIGNQTWMAENLNYEVKSFFGLFSVGRKML